MSALSRRTFAQSLATGVTLGLGLRPDPVAAAPVGESEQAEPIVLDLPQLKYPGNWNPRAGALAELASEVRMRSRLETKTLPSEVEISSPDLFTSPFLYLSGQGTFPDLDDQGRARLRRFIDLGGMMVIDDADGGASLDFRNQAMATMADVLGGAKFAPLRDEHVLYRSFYLIKTPMGRTRALDHVLCVHEQGRIKALFFPNDLAGALARHADGSYRYACEPGGEVQREWAIRFAINIVLYATCTDYKADPAHVETLLRRRVWR